MFPLSSLGTKGRHNNVPPEIPKPESNGSPVEEQSPVAEAPKDVPIEAYTPPDESLIEKIKIVELASVAKAPAVKNIVICKNCKSEESSLDPEGECLYHRGVQVYVTTKIDLLLFTYSFSFCLPKPQFS